MMKSAVMEVVNETVVFAASQSSSKLVAYVDSVGGALLERLSAIAAAVGSAGARLSTLELIVLNDKEAPCGQRVVPAREGIRASSAVG